jgi:fluoride exporter
MAGRDGPLWAALVAVGMGGAAGAWLRWGLSYWLNPRVPAVPLGTLAANVVGGYLVGIAVALFAAHPALSPFWRLLIITGFLGGLTTFSTFSAENVLLLGTGAWGAALLHAGLHLVGSLVATAAGIATYRALT